MGALREDAELRQYELVPGGSVGLVVGRVAVRRHRSAAGWRFRPAHRSAAYPTFAGATMDGRRRPTSYALAHVFPATGTLVLRDPLDVFRLSFPVGAVVFAILGDWDVAVRLLLPGVAVLAAPRAMVRAWLTRSTDEEHRTVRYQFVTQRNPGRGGSNRRKSPP